MWQEISIGLLFTVALFYLGRMVYRMFARKEGCGEGCGCASSVSIDAIEEKLKNDKRFEKSSR
ncbi:MAG TPA: hypothetical protein VK750_08060 [Cytophagaceae bacterium]|jgi:hypothetical protein|nr:hypothetical protein [Cytophagaceae bacterium]